MGKVKVIVGLLVFALFLSTGWQIASCELANYQFKDELRDVASLNGSRIGLVSQQTDEDLRATVIQKAANHDIALEADQILIRRSGTEENPKLYLAARYQARVWIPGMALVFHFTATSRG